MASIDQVHNTNLVTAAPLATRNTAYTGPVINLATVAGAPYYAKTYHVLVGTVTDGTHVPVVKESADNVTYTAVAFSDLIIPSTNNAPVDANGNFTAAFANLATGVAQKVGYNGVQPYIRLDATESGATGAAWEAKLLLGKPAHLPV